MKQHHTIEIFSANCPLCSHIIKDIQIGKCQGCNQMIYNINEMTDEIKRKMKEYGITYQANPPRINLQQNASAAESNIQLKTLDNAKPGTYTAMVKVQTTEQQEDSLVISRLYPVKLVLDVPQPPPTSETEGGQFESNGTPVSTHFGVTDLIKALAIGAAIGLAGYIVYRKIKRKTTHL